jgi:hypothetical protein
MSNERRIVPQLVEQYNDLIEQNLVQNYFTNDLTVNQNNDYFLLNNQIINESNDDSISDNNKTLLTDSQLILNEELVINEENICKEEVDQNNRLIGYEDNVIQTNDVLGLKLIFIFIKFFFFFFLN